MATKINTAMNVLGTVAAGASFLGLGTSKSNFDNKIGEFYSNFGKKGYTKTNRFEVLFNIPPILIPHTATYNFSETPRLLSLRCEGASVPGISLNTSDGMRHGYGLTEKIVNGAQYGNFTCSFIGDQAGDIYKFFHVWMLSIVKFNEKPSYVGDGPSGNATGAFPFEYSYKNEYAASINLITYNENSDTLRTFDIFEAFPTAIGDIQYNWGDTDNLVRIPIQFAYTYFKVKDITDKIKLSDNVGGGLGLFGTLIKVGTAAQVLGSIKKPQSIGDIINVVNNAKTVLSGFNFN